RRWPRRSARWKLLALSWLSRRTGMPARRQARALRPAAARAPRPVGAEPAAATGMTTVTAVVPGLETVMPMGAATAAGVAAGRATTAPGAAVARARRG